VDSSKKPQRPHTPAPDTSQSGERRRISRIVHDDRGNASVEWLDAPMDYKRPVLEIEQGGLSIKSEETHNPYARHTLAERKRDSTTTRTDLRKLSEWIKLRRQVEENKRNPTDDED
jgi:hypothetical protein